MSEHPAPALSPLQAPWWATYRITVDDEAVEHRRDIGAVNVHGDYPITVEVVQRDDITPAGADITPAGDDVACVGAGSIGRGPAQVSVMGRWLTAAEAHHLTRLLLAALADISSDPHRRSQTRQRHLPPGNTEATTIPYRVYHLSTLAG